MIVIGILLSLFFIGAIVGIPMVIIGAVIFFFQLSNCDWLFPSLYPGVVGYLIHSNRPEIANQWKVEYGPSQKLISPYDVEEIRR